MPSRTGPRRVASPRRVWRTRALRGTVMPDLPAGGGARGVPSVPTTGGALAQRTVTIASAVGLHARPAALFVRAATATGLHVTIGRDGADTSDAVDAAEHPGGHGPGRPPRRAGSSCAPRATARRTCSTSWPACSRATWTATSERPVGAAPAALRDRSQPGRRGRAGAADAPTGASPASGSLPRPTWRRPDDGCARRWTPSPPRSRQRAGTADATAREILEATAMMARDPGLAGAVDTHLAQGCGPATALAAAAEDYCARFVAAGGYLAERVTDLRDVCDRAVARRARACRSRGCPPSRGRASSSPTTSRRPRRPAGPLRSSSPSSPRPAERTATPRPRRPARHPGRRAGGGRHGAHRRHAGGASTATPGWWWSTPTRPIGPSWSSAREQRARALAASHGPGRTSDGVPVALMANIGTVQDAVTAAAQDVEGVGLFRTELLFLGRGHRPQPRAADRDLHPGVRAVRRPQRRRPHPGRRRRQAAVVRRPGPGGQPGPGAARAAPLGAATGPARHPARRAGPGGPGDRRRRPGHGADGRHRRGGRLVRPPGPRARPAVGRGDDRGPGRGAAGAARPRRGRLRQHRHQRPGAVHPGRRPELGELATCSTRGSRPCST